MVRYAALLGLAVACVPAIGAVPAAAAVKVNRNPRFLQVYDDNVENLPTTSDRPCPGDWRDLVSFVKTRTLVPDVFLVQQVSGRRQLDGYARYLSRRLPGTWRGVIAKANPRRQGTKCRPAKLRQTNAILYRTGRLAPVANTRATWRADSWHKATKTRRAGCRDSPQDRAIGVRQLFGDRVAHRFVLIGSIHWPTARSGGARCRAENARETALAMNGLANLRIVGGDTNARPGQGHWYSDLLFGFGYEDAALSVCPAADRPGCGSREWTNGRGRRIDFLFARTGTIGPAPITAFDTISFSAAGAADRRLTGTDSALPYSDHRALRAHVYYP